MTDRGPTGRIARAPLWSWLAPLGNVVGVVCGLVGVVTDLFSTAVRVTIVVVGLLLWAGASIGSVLVARSKREDEETIQQLRTRLVSAGVMDREMPDHALRMIAPVLFLPGASWRLTLFVLEEDAERWFLRPRIRCASSEMYESVRRERIAVESSVLREIMSRDLPASGEQGDAPDREVAPREWIEWQRNFMDEGEAVDSLRMPTRKYAWSAVRQPGLGGRTLALVAETVQPSGIHTEVLASNLLPPILEMVARLVAMPEVMDSVRES